jgi:hypothetical protein
MRKAERELPFIVFQALNNGGCIKTENKKSFRHRTKHKLQVGKHFHRKDARKIYIETKNQ